MCEHVSANRNMGLAIVLMAYSHNEGVELPKWVEGRVIKLWESAYTFSYHYGSTDEVEHVHYRDTLEHYSQERMAREAMANFVKALNISWHERETTIL
jgi:hypothetical protein